MVLPHFTINDLSKAAFHILDADGDEVSSTD
jgi:hypothetical protein